MTKQEEIETIRQFADAMGGTYTGALLAMLAPQIEADIRADIEPAFNLRAAQAEIRAARDAHRRECAILETAAKRQVEAAEMRCRELQRVADTLALRLDQAVSAARGELVKLR